MYTLIRPRAVDGVVEMVRGSVGYSPSGHPAHWHGEWQLVAVTRGDGWVRMGETTHRTAAGSLFLVPPEVVHSNGVFEHGCTFRSILIDPSLVRGIADATGLRLVRQAIRELPVWDSVAMTRRFEALHRRLERRTPSLHAESELESLLICLLENRGRQVAQATAAVAHPAARRARECLWSRAEEHLSLAELAKEAGLSRFELVRQFKAAYGMPPHAWQLQARVGRVKVLLKKGVPPAEAAIRLGFADQAHLGRVFRNATGFTPARFQSEFRKNVQDAGGKSHDDAS